jgi:hypothetical protein
VTRFAYYSLKIVGPLVIVVAAGCKKNCFACTQHAVKKAGKFIFTMAKPSIKIICRELSHWQKLFPVGLSIGKNYFLHAES